MKTLRHRRAFCSICLFLTTGVIIMAALATHLNHDVDPDKSHTWLHVHAFFGFFWLINLIWHLKLNWKTLVSNVKYGLSF